MKCCFIKALLVGPQARITEAPYSVCICLQDDSTILAGECGCVAGFGNGSCTHVFSLPYYIYDEVRLGRNKSCTGKEQQWSVRKRKRGKFF